jgi:hypothetical protein
LLAFPVHLLVASVCGVVRRCWFRWTGPPVSLGTTDAELVDPLGVLVLPGRRRLVVVFLVGYVCREASERVALAV